MMSSSSDREDIGDSENPDEDFNVREELDEEIEEVDQEDVGDDDEEEEEDEDDDIAEVVGDDDEDIAVVVDDDDGDCPMMMGDEESSLPLEPYSAFLANQEMQTAAKDLAEQRKKKPGIIYLSSIPPGFNVSQTTSFFSKFGKVGRIFLQPDPKEKNKKDKYGNRTFTEGWVEFMSKKVAKEVAESLNASQVGGKKRNKAHDVMWNIKYLPRFKWGHLTERLNYEKAVHHQKMRNEIAQAKREADFFKSNVEKSKRLKRMKTGGGNQQQQQQQRTYEFRQKETEESIQSKKRKRSSSSSTGGNNSMTTTTTTTEPSTSSFSKKSRQETSKRGKKKSGKGGGGGRSDFLQSVFGGSGN